MRSKNGWPERFAAVCLLLALAACDRGAPETRQLYAFGTVVSLKMYGVGSEQADAAVADLETEFRRIDANWYPWRKSGTGTPGSLVAVNDAIAAGRSIEVDPQLADLIRRAAEIEKLTDGRFNAAAGRLSELWGFDDLSTEPPGLPDAADIDALLQSGISTTYLDWDGNRLSSRSRAVKIDPGGIAKGAILQEARGIMDAHGIHNAIVDLGGDLLVMGSTGSRAARIGIRSPREAGIVGWLEIADGESVMTSGDYERYFEIDGKRYQHILDPRSGYPVSHTVSATVVHRDAALADAAATALVVGGMSGFDRLCSALGLEFAMIIDSAGDMRLTPAMQKRVNWSN